MAFFSDVTSVHTLKIAITLFTFLVLLSCSIPKYADDEKSEANAEAIFKVHPDLRPLWEGQHRDGSLWTIHTLRRIDNIQDSFLETVPNDVNIFWNAKFLGQVRSFLGEVRSDRCFRIFDEK